MRTLVVGAGAVGGYFGGRLAETGRDVTFLVRPRRAAELAAAGLRIRSRHGDATIASPQTVLAENLAQPFEVILLSCKAYDLDSAIESFAPAVGPDTAILPLLNGMRHLRILGDRFGSGRVLGGLGFIAATLATTDDDKREIVHLSEPHGLTFGEIDGGISPRVRAISDLMQGAIFVPQSSPAIVLEMWEKWVFLATLAGSTCLMRASIGNIAAAPGGTDFILRLFDECRSIAVAEGYPPREESLERARGTLTSLASTLTASMLRDVESGNKVEADHIMGDLLRRAHAHGSDAPLLSLAYTHLKSYEARRGATAP
ncbi:MAG TPA: 2-dehydropantoate 2-reductase [Bryobacteraceae bacterium]|nr:2-dehydropantoate 2-reductase [Bryobacteraceae bacterium]